MLQMLDWANEFGGIYRFCLGYQWVVVISDPKLAVQASEPWMNAWNAGLVSQPWSTCMGESCRLAMGHLGQDRPVGLWVAPHQGFKSGLGVTQHSGFWLRQVMRLACKHWPMSPLLLARATMFRKHPTSMPCLCLMQQTRGVLDHALCKQQHACVSCRCWAVVQGQCHASVWATSSLTWWVYLNDLDGSSNVLPHSHSVTAEARGRMHGSCFSNAPAIRIAPLADYQTCMGQTTPVYQPQSPPKLINQTRLGVCILSPLQSTNHTVR